MAGSTSEADLERRIRDRAHYLWVADGRPAGGERDYLDRARELVAIEDNQDTATEPRPKHDEAFGGRQPVESPRAAQNQGEFPNLTDQGEKAPMAPKRRG